MSICLPFLLYVCDFFSKDHAYTSIEDYMAIGDPRVRSVHKKMTHECFLRVYMQIVWLKIGLFIRYC